MNEIITCQGKAIKKSGNCSPIPTATDQYYRYRPQHWILLSICFDPLPAGATANQPKVVYG
jgi:hypothetical protein